FIERTLKVGDFDVNGNFDFFYMDSIQSLGRYEYPAEFGLPKNIGQMVDSPSPIEYIDWESYTGIQFWVDWLREDTLCTLYIDYAEVYDNDGWDDFINQPEETAQLIKTYAGRFSQTEWPNLKYWIGVDEPYSIDCYTPIHVVDELIKSVQAPPLVVHFDPSWWHTLNINGDDEMEMFYNIAKPEKIVIGMYPCSPNWPAIRKQDFDWLRFNFSNSFLR
ncbi:MAG: hypothetical protein OQJ78_09570, partial [Ignavibacteriaceae bacterium]|nr:hypothetical protein [Ignavibacteriaceae bacterium]